MTAGPGRRFDRIEDLSASPSGGFSGEALTAECLAAIVADERADPPLNAIRCIVPHALERARELDRAPPNGRGVLHGIPIALKDNIDIEGLPTTSGCVALEHAMPWRDAEVVRRLSAAGAVIVAKTNLSEFSFEIRSRSSLGGDVLNPFNRAVTAGGSSGGAAAAVAAGFAFAAIGTDTGGSIRTPASFNGLVGLRPTHGAIDGSGVAPLAPSTDTVGCLARSVGDAGRLFAVVSGRSDDGGWSGPPPPVESVRLGVLRQAFGRDDEVISAMEAALSVTASDGWTVEPVTLPTELLDFSGDHIVDLEFRPAFDAYLSADFREGAPGSLAEILSTGRFLPDHCEALARKVAVGEIDTPARRQVLARHARLRRGLSQLFRRHRLDALVYPTSAVVPTSLDNPAGGWAPELAACSGWPAITLPVAQARNGVPIGLELLGEAHGEAELLRLAAATERRVGKRCLPPVAA